MPQAQCVKYPIKPAHRETLVNWMARLEDRSTELVEASLSLFAFKNATTFWSTVI
jgi:hypothetical protein